MVTQHVKRSFGFFKTTAVGGIFFLLPLVVVVALLGQTAQILWVIADAGRPYIPIDTPLGYGLLFLSAIALVLLACFLSGVIARRSIASKFTGSIEKYLIMIFPRYAIFKEQLSGNIGGDLFTNRLRPILVKQLDFQRLAFEVERMPDGRVTVFLPGSPDPWSGTVVLVQPTNIEPLSISFSEAIGTLEKLGQEMQQLMIKHESSQSHCND